MEVESSRRGSPIHNEESRGWNSKLSTFEGGDEEIQQVTKQAPFMSSLPSISKVILIFFLSLFTFCLVLISAGRGRCGGHWSVGTRECAQPVSSPSVIISCVVIILELSEI